MKFCVLVVATILGLAVAGESEGEPYNEYDHSWLRIALGRWTMTRCTEEILVIVIPVGGGLVAIIMRCEYECRITRIA